MSRVYLGLSIAWLSIVGVACSDDDASGSDGISQIDAGEPPMDEAADDDDRDDTPAADDDLPGDDPVDDDAVDDDPVDDDGPGADDPGEDDSPADDPVDDDPLDDDPITDDSSDPPDAGPGIVDAGPTDPPDAMPTEPTDGGPPVVCGRLTCAADETCCLNCSASGAYCTPFGCDAGACFVDCGAQDARWNGNECLIPLGFVWNGTACEELLCGCEGSECDSLWVSKEQCEANYAMCEPPPPSVCGSITCGEGETCCEECPGAEYCTPFGCDAGTCLLGDAG